MLAQDRYKWTAIVQRNKEADGYFFYGVKTTKIFCRPGCSSRLPKIDNVVFFDTTEKAKESGYRPCKRCNPEDQDPNKNLRNKIIKLCQEIEKAEIEPSLEHLAKLVHLSPSYLQRLFKDIVGVTPKEYAVSNKMKQFKINLKENDSITSAIYESGFTSSSRAYEKLSDRMGMTPSSFKSGGKGVQIKYGIASCSLGWVLVGKTGKGICCIELGDSPDQLQELVQKDFPNADLKESSDEFSNLLQDVVNLIEHPNKKIDLPLDFQGTAFQEKVWKALMKIQSGQTMSYSELADKIGNPKAVRAVAKACTSNKIAVAIPCHRVVKKNGNINGYKWGIQRKKKLLEREANDS